MDFALVMLVALCGTGLLWLLDRLFWAPARMRKAEAMAGEPEEEIQKVRREPAYVEYARAFFPVILVVFLVRSFVVEPFRIPSGSMLPPTVLESL